MKNHKRALAFALAVSATAGLSACSDDGGEHGYLNATETTTQQTVALNTETLAAEEEEQVAELTDSLTDTELENKNIKWLAFWDPWHPTGQGNSKPVAVELFEKKYGGTIEYYPTTWENMANDLSVSVLGGEGIDFFPGMDSIPKYVISGMMQSYDDYISWESPLWKSVKELNDSYMIGGSHYAMICDITEGYVVYYNRKTIEEMGYDDPAELYANGEWTTEKFKSMLTDFVDEEEGRYGLDGWFNSTPLYEAFGVPTVSIKDGKVSNNLNDPNLGRAMEYQYELYRNGLILDKSLFGWNPQIQYIGEGKELFYIGGIYELTKAPEIWSKTFGEVEDVMFVPIPKDDEADRYYYNAQYEYSYNLCTGAQNPIGTTLFMECVIAAQQDENAVKINDNKYKNDYGWSEEMVDMAHEVKRLSMENPVWDCYNGLNSDMVTLIGDSINKPFGGEEWHTTRESVYDAVQLGIDEINAQIQQR